MKLNLISFLILFSLVFIVSGAEAQESENVELVGQMLYPDLSESHAIDVLNDFVYFVDDAGLKIFDVSRYPIVTGFLDIQGGEASGGGIKVVGDLAYIGAGANGFHVVDISNPSMPESVGFLEIEGIAKGVSLQNQYAYLACGNTSFCVIDVSDPAAPELAGSYDIGNGNTANSAIRNDLAYVAAGQAGLQIIDISNPADIQLVGSFGNNANDLKLRGDFAYIAAGTDGFMVVDVSDPENTVLVGSYPTSGAAQSVEIIANYAYVAEISIWVNDVFLGGGFRIVDISDPERLNQAAFYRNVNLGLDESQDLRDVSVVAGRAYLAEHVPGDHDGLRILNVSNPRTPDEWALYEGDDPNDVILANGIAFIGGADLDIIDMSQLDAPQSIGYLNVGNEFLRIDLVGEMLYALDPGNGLRAIDVSDLSIPTKVGFVEIPGTFVELAVAGQLAFVASEADGIRVFDVSNPADLSVVTLFDTPGSASDVFVIGNIAYVADGPAGLFIIDFTIPLEPEVLGSIQTPDDAYALVVVDDIAYVSTRTEGLTIINVADPGNLEILATLDTPGDAVDVFVQGDYAYLADLQGGLRTMNIDYPDDPEEDGYYISPNASYRVFAEGEVIAVAGAGEVGFYNFIPPAEFSNIIVDPVDLAFGEVFVSEEASLTFTIANDGRANLIVTDITVAGDDGFSTDFEGEISLIRNSDQEFTAFFAPEVAGDLAATVTIHSNDPDEPEVVINLVGTGFTLPSIQIDPVMIETIDGGEHHISVINTGNGPLTWTSEVEILGDPENDQWISWVPMEGVVEAGQFEDVIVTLFSDEFVPGNYSAELHFLSDDQVNPDVFTDIHMEVVGAPTIVLDPEAIDFGAVMLNEERMELLSISNQSNGDLVIENIFVDGNQSFAVMFDAEIVIPWGEESILSIIFLPTDRGAANSELVIVSNDPQNPETRVDLMGTGIAGPTISVNPMEINASGTSDNAITLGNQGDLDLEWSANVVTVPDPRLDDNQRAVRSIGPIRNPQFDHRSGADDLGYEWRDNREMDGPEFNWYTPDEFEGVQLLQLGDNENTGALQLGFSFPLWDRAFAEVYCHSDGWMSFTDGGEQSQPDAWGNFPVEGQTENCIMIHNRNYHEGTNVWFWTNETDKAIIWWAGDFEQNTQLILFSSGLAVMQYGAGVIGQFPWWRIGVNLGDGEHGWSMSLNERWFLREGLSIAFGPSHVWNNWVTLDMNEGVIATDEEQILTLSIDAEGLLSGTYHANLYITSNDNANGEVIIDVNLLIESFWADVTDIEVDGGGESVFNLYNYFHNDINWISDAEVISIPEQNNPGEWLAWQPREGLLESNSFQEVVVTLNGDVVVLGDYEANLIFSIDGDNLSDISISILLHVYDTQIEALGMIDTPGASWEVIVRGNYAYICDEAAGLHIVDITDKNNPELVGTYDTPGNANRAFILGDYAYVADRDAGLRIIDISNTQAPSEAGFYETPGIAYDVEVSRGYAFVTDRDGGMIILDVSDPANSEFVSSIDVFERYAYGIEIVDDMAYVGDRQGGLYIFDVADKANPQLLGVLDTPGLSYDIYVEDDLAYVADGSSGLRIVDVSDPTNPMTVGLFNTPGTAHSLAVVEGHAFIADVIGGLRVINVEDPANPRWVDSYGGFTEVWGISVDRGYAHVAAMAEGYGILDVSAYTGGHANPPIITVDPLNIQSHNGGEYAIGITNEGDRVLSWETELTILLEQEGGDNDWIAVEPTAGVTDPGQTTEMQVTLDPAGWADGDYAADLCILSNDNDNPEVIVNIQMHVGDFIGGHYITFYSYLGTYIPGEGPGEVIPISGDGDIVEEGDLYLLQNLDLGGLNLGESMLVYLSAFSSMSILAEIGSLGEDIEVHLILNNLVVEGGGEDPLELVGIYSPDPDLENSLWMFAEMQVWSVGPESVQLNADEDYVFLHDSNMIVDFTLNEQFAGMKALLGLEYEMLGVALWDTDVNLWDEANISGETVDVEGTDHFIITLDHLSIIGGGPADGFSNNEEFIIPLRANWNLISSPVTPIDSDIITIWAEIVGRQNLYMVKDQDGRFYSPQFGFNNLDPWDTHFGYQPRLNQAEELVMIGIPIPVETAIPLRSGWSIVAYYPDVNLDVAIASASVGEALVMVKNVSGRFYLPEFGFSNMAPLTQGQGYKVKVSEATELVWNVPEEGLASVSNPQCADPVHYIAPEQTGHDMSVLILGNETNSGLEVAAKTVEGQIVGVGVFDETGRVGLTVWGDDPTTESKDGLAEGEAFALKVWDSERAVELDLNAGLTISGSLSFSTDAFTVLGEIKISNPVPDEYYLAQNYPNPFNSLTRLTYGMPEDGTVSIALYDISGRFVTTLVTGAASAGTHSIAIDSRRLVSGVYLVQMESRNFKTTRKLILIK